MGFLGKTLFYFSSLLLLSCSTTTKKEEIVSEAETVRRALAYQKNAQWALAETEWNKLSPSSPYFPKAFYETQKLSYRLEAWNNFFAKAEIYKRAYKQKLYCPELYLLHSFAYTRNCLFNEAQEALQQALVELDSSQQPQCSRYSKSKMKEHIQELSSVLKSNIKLKASSPVNAKDDPLKRNLWPLSPEIFEKIQQLPIKDGLSLVGVEVKNRCGS